MEFSERVEKVRTIPAHTTPLSALTLNMQGTMLATASQKGTLGYSEFVMLQTLLFPFPSKKVPPKPHALRPTSNVV